MGTYRSPVRAYAADAPAAGGKSDGLGSPTESNITGTGGVCYSCHRPGHYVAECPISPAHENVATVPFTAQQCPHPMHCGGGWVQESPAGSDGYTATVVPPPQPFSNNSHEQLSSCQYVLFFYICISVCSVSVAVLEKFDTCVFLTSQFYRSILRTSAVSSTNLGSILIFGSCVVGTCNILCG